MHAYAFASDDAALRSARPSLDSTIEILERERDRLIPLVVEGPPHLRSLRLRQLKSIQQRLVSAQSEQAESHPELRH